MLESFKITKDEDYDRYGVAGGDLLEEGILDVKTIVEKPGKANAPGDMANVSGFLFVPEIFNYLERVLAELKEGQEFYYNDALKQMLNDGHRVVAQVVKNGKYYDTGNKLEYLKTVVEFAIRHEELGGDFKNFLRGLDLT